MAFATNCVNINKIVILYLPVYIDGNKNSNSVFSVYLYKLKNQVFQKKLPTSKMNWSV